MNATARGGAGAMEDGYPSTGLTMVAACTAAAAHRRDHGHKTSAEACHPHAVEVIHLGTRAISICHDCGADSGFVPARQAERLTVEHQQQTRSVGVALAPLAAA